MSQYVETPCRTFEAGAAIAQHLRVKLSAGVLAVAGASDLALGTMERASLASGDKVPVRLRTAQGTRKYVAASSFSVGVAVYGAASGKVDDVGSQLIGTALEASGADGDVIEVLPAPHGDWQGVQTVNPDDADGVGVNMILPSSQRVVVGAAVNGVNDWITLPSLADCPNGHRITILCSAGGAFEMRTPAGSAEEINSEDCDGTKEYLCTDTQIIEVIKINNTIGWMAHAYSAIGAVVTAVVPD